MCRWHSISIQHRPYHIPQTPIPHPIHHPLHQHHNVAPTPAYITPYHPASFHIVTTSHLHQLGLAKITQHDPQSSRVNNHYHISTKKCAFYAFYIGHIETLSHQWWWGWKWWATQSPFPPLASPSLPHPAGMENFKCTFNGESKTSLKEYNNK